MQSINFITPLTAFPSDLSELSSAESPTGVEVQVDQSVAVHNGNIPACMTTA